MSEEVVCVKVEPEWEPAAEVEDSKADVVEELYKDHQIKRELVLGPETLQRPDVAYTLQGLKHLKNDKEELTTDRLHIQEETKENKNHGSISVDVPTTTQVVLEMNADVGEMCLVKHITDTTEISVTNNNYTIVNERMHSTETDKPFKCRKGSLETHKRIHSVDKPYQCGHCNYSSVSKSNVKVHERLHTGEKLYQCSNCSFATSKKSHLTVHERICDAKPYICGHCGHASTHIGAFKAHMKTMHPGEKLYKCSHCSYASLKKNHLTVHERIHTGNKPYKCSYCSYTSSKKNNLAVHERNHTGDNPFKCSHCSYTSSKKSTVTIHERIHTGENP